MSLEIKDEGTIAAIEEMARETGETHEEIMRRAIIAQKQRQHRANLRMAVIKELQESWARVPKSGLKADKAFFDDLGGGL